MAVRQQHTDQTGTSPSLPHTAGTSQSHSVVGDEPCRSYVLPREPEAQEHQVLTSPLSLAIRQVRQRHTNQIGTSPSLPHTAGTAQSHPVVGGEPCCSYALTHEPEGTPGPIVPCEHEERDRSPPAVPSPPSSLSDFEVEACEYLDLRRGAK